MLPKIRNGMGQCLAALEHVQCQQLYKTQLRCTRELGIFHAALAMSTQLR